MELRVDNFVRGYARAFAVRGDRTVLVDAGARGGKEKLAAGLESIGVTLDSVSLIVVTHAHPDHVAPLPALRQLTSAPVMAHDTAAAVMATGWGEPTVPRTAFARLVTRLIPRPTESNRHPMDVDVRIGAETDLSPYGIAGVALPTPGHTLGSLSVILESGEAIIGDLCMAFGRGRAKLPMLAEDIDAVKSSLQMLLDRGVHTFYLAHGGKRSRAEIEPLV